MSNLGSGQICNKCSFPLKRGKTRCSKCGSWVAFLGLREQVVTHGTDDDGTILLSDVPEHDVQRITTGPWDRNFGSPPGVPCESVVLLGGAPGAGKSTVALQWASALAEGTGREALYLCAEESGGQIKNRALRLGCRADRIRIVPLEKMGDVVLEDILEKRRPGGVVLDSIAGFTSEPDKAVEIVSGFKFFATYFRAPFIVINHVTKDGDMAGMMRLQHAGDISLMLTKDSGDTCNAIDVASNALIEVTEMRELYTEKSRYGPSGESTFYAMTEKGLRLVKPEEDDEEIPKLPPRAPSAVGGAAQRENA